ncbi:6-deoxyerythronolide-B synthase [Paracoccus aminophilus JCM 7686]|uniref:6-deoxyerythronolide-B synthase n=2 Tax=Paracoccus aminophilus TaxID=34003 RepID=S5XLM5_PARAH|nr:6-deoxyerythronolide-B synthase [Paracoccus aminophilus JCM 7686]
MVSEVPEDRWDRSAIFDPERQIPKSGAFLDDIKQFDGGFFGMSPREIAQMDPQQRLALTVSWEALEDAGLSQTTLNDARVGVYFGVIWHDYELAHRTASQLHTPHSAVGQSNDVIATRISYAFGFQGPSLIVNTGCSSSLVALHLAQQALLAGEIDIAVVGGVNAMIAPEVMVALTRFGGLSMDGTSKAFAASADGFGRGEGAGVIVLERLSAARAAGRRVYTLIRETAVNNDGGGNQLTAPLPQGQINLLAEIYGRGSVAPGEVDYVEAHGTGTAAGDPVEAEALGAILGAGRTVPLRIGSVKTNIGHQEGGAGVAGVIKAALCTYHGRFVPSLHFTDPNPKIDFDGWALQVQTSDESWTKPRAARFCGVSSFGWGGTNAHVVLQGAPEEITSPPAAAAAASQQTMAGPPLLLGLSAHTAEALAQRRRHAADLIAQSADPRDVAFTYTQRRQRLNRRFCAIGATAAELAEMLRSADLGDEASSEALIAAAEEEGTGEHGPGARSAGDEARSVWVFPGHGSQWLRMGKPLYDREAVFRDSIDACAAALREFVDWDLIAFLTEETSSDWLARVDVVQPALWAMQVSLSKLWESYGVTPAVVVGHSMGEVAAASVAGALSLRDGARIIALRSLIAKQQSGKGGMLVVDLSYEDALDLIEPYQDQISVGVSSSPQSTVLSGDLEALREIEALLEVEETFCKWVRVDYASHSPQMDPLKAELRAALREVAPQPTRFAMLSTVTLDQVAGPDLTADYWVDNLREPVRFAQAIRQLVEAGHLTFIEMSPHPILLPALAQNFAALDVKATAIETLSRDQGTLTQFWRALCRAYCAGVPFDDGAVLFAGARQIEVTRYPWQFEDHWFPTKGGAANIPALGRHPVIGVPVEAGRAGLSRLIWESTLGLSRFPFLADHRVAGAIVCPGAFYIEALRAAVEQLGGEAVIALETIQFAQLLVLDEDQDYTVQVTFTGTAAEGGLLEFRSRPVEAEPTADWTVHCRAHFVPGQAPVAEHRAAAHRTAAVLPENPEAAARFYADVAATGLDYGEAFRAITAIEPVHGGVAARVEAGAALGAGLGLYGAHPVLLDGVLQTCLAHPALLALGLRQPVPIAIERCRLAGDWAGTLSIEVEGVTPLSSQGCRIDAVRVFGPDGSPIGEISGLELKEAFLSQDTGGSGLIDAEWGREWTELVPATGPMAPTPKSGRWLVLAQDADLLERIKAAAPEGVALHLVTLPETAELAELLRREDWAQVIFCPDASDDRADHAQGVSWQAITVMRAALAAPSEPRLWFLTSRSLTAPDYACANPWLAGLRGLTRTAAYEAPGLRVSLLDLAGLDPAALRRGMALIQADQPGEEFAIGPEKDWVNALAPESLAEIDAPASYLGLQNGGPYRLSLAQPGSTSGLHLSAAHERPLAEDKIRVRVSHAALNFIDLMKVMGIYPGLEPGALALGGECAGEVVAVGGALTQTGNTAGGNTAGGIAVGGIAVGQPVMVATSGAFSREVDASAFELVALPKDLSLEAASAQPLVYMTAWYGLHHLARLRPGERVLIHSGTGGLGLAAIAVARSLGAEVLATAGSEARRQHLREMGISCVADSRSLDFVAAVRAHTKGEGVDVVLNSLTGQALSAGMELLRFGGRFVEVGKKDIYRDAPLNLGAFRKSLSFFAVDLASLQKEQPALFLSLLREVAALLQDGQVPALPVTTFPVDRAAEAFDYLSKSQHIGKVVLEMTGATGLRTQALDGGQLRRNGIYLITGGLGALGLATARLFAERGAGHLILCGRSAPGPAARDEIAALEDMGCTVSILPVDVAQSAQLRAALLALGERVNESEILGKINGVVHAAGVLDDATLEQVSEAQLARVFRPKVMGAWALDSVLADAPLDFFLFYSSAAALFGSPGQSAYAAANAVLDALAECRRAQGKPATSINWGPFADIGLAAQDARRGKRLDAQGMRELSVTQGMDALIDILHAQPVTIGIVPFEPGRWCEAHPSVAGLQSFAALLRSETGGTARRQELLRQVVDAPVEDRARLLADGLRSLLARVLGQGEDRISDETPFRALGLDSLMSLELRNRLEKSLGLKLAPTLLFRHSTVAALSDFLLGSLATAGAWHEAGTAGEPPLSPVRSERRGDAQ